MPLSKHQISIIKGMLHRGDKQSDIATYFGCNGGRIAEVSTGNKGSDIDAAPLSKLPPAGPYSVTPEKAEDGDVITAARGSAKHNFSGMLPPQSDDEVITDIERNIHNPPVGSVVYRITPSVAKHIVEKYNRGNRSLKPVKVAEYSSDMASGKWGVNGETIKFTDDSLLRDGQNRLFACIKADKPFVTHIVFGVDHLLFNRMDVGKVRNQGDMLKIQGYKNASDLAAGIRWTWLIDEGIVKSRQTIHPKEICTLAKRYGDMADEIDMAKDVFKVTNLIPKGQLIALFYHLNRKNPRKADEFKNALAHGSNKGKYKPIGLLQQKLTQMQADTNSRPHDVTRLAVVIKAWNLFVSGKRGYMPSVQWNRYSDDFPEIEA